MSRYRQHFLFLEIRDRDFNAFYDDAVTAITGKPPLKPPHLTVRGPYKKPISPDGLERYREAMKFAVLEIAGLGHFANPDGEVVYLSVESPHLRELWWKPDFPIGEYGFNPHISLYRGADRELAERLMAFAPLQRVRFLCAEFDLVPFVKKRDHQKTLELRSLERAPDHQRFERSRAITPGFFERLAAAAQDVGDGVPAT